MNKPARLLALAMVLLLALANVACISEEQAAAPAAEAAVTVAPAASAESAQPETTALKPGEGATKAAIILGGTEDDYGFNYGLAKFAEQMRDELGLEVIVKENVPQNADVEGVMEELIAQGCRIIVPSQFGYLEYTKNVAKRNPDVAFYSIPITDYNGDNFSTVHGEIHDVWYLEGVLAGLFTKTDKIGFVGSIPIPDVIMAVNAFALGIQSVKPDATITAVFTGSWSDSGLQTVSVNQLIDGGCDVIAPFQDSVKTVIEICASRGVHAFGCNADAYELDTKTWLSACVNTWDGWIPYIKQAIEGNYETVNVSGSFDVKLQDLATFGDDVPQEIRDQVMAVRQQIIDGGLYVFEGPVYSQSGELIFAEGYRPPIEEINMLSVLVKGVNGTLN